MRRYGEDPATPNPALLNAAMDSAISELHSSVLSVRVQVAAETAVDRLTYLMGILGPWVQMANPTDDARAAISSAMATIDNIINRLDGPDRAEVLAGTLDAGKWYAAAKEVSKGVADLLKMYDGETRVAYFNDKMDAVANQFKSLGAKISSGPFGWDIPLWVWLVGGGVGLLLVLNYFTPLLTLVVPRRSFRGHEPKRLPSGKRRKKRKSYGWSDPETRDLDDYGWDDNETKELS